MSSINTGSEMVIPGCCRGRQDYLHSFRASNAAQRLGHIPPARQQPQPALPLVWVDHPYHDWGYYRGEEQSQVRIDWPDGTWSLVESGCVRAKP
jgi:hypothetical protein